MDEKRLKDGLLKIIKKDSKLTKEEFTNKKAEIFSYIEGYLDGEFFETLKRWKEIYKL